jgi:hypothetical protein
MRELAIARMFKEVHGSWENHDMFPHRLWKLKISYQFNKYMLWASVHSLQLTYNSPQHLKLTFRWNKCIATKPVFAQKCVGYYYKVTICASIAAQSYPGISCKMKKRTFEDTLISTWSMQVSLKYSSWTSSSQLNPASQNNTSNHSSVVAEFVTVSMCYYTLWNTIKFFSCLMQFIYSMSRKTCRTECHNITLWHFNTRENFRLTCQGLT